MTTGTTTNYDESRLTIIQDALILLGVNEAGQTINEADMQLGVRWLNRMVKQWQGLGIHVWTNDYATVYFQVGEPIYSLGSESQGGSHWAGSPVEQTITADAAQGDTTIDVNSSVPISVNDHIGIVDNAGLLQWTLVASKPSDTSVTLTDPLLNPVSTGNYVYSYTERPASGAPLRILQMNLKNNLGQQTATTMMPGLSFLDFFQLTQKLSLGTPVNWTYQKNVDKGELRLWPTPNQVTQRAVIQYTRPIFNFDEATTTQDIPQEWLTAIVYNLAVLLAPSFGASNLLQVLGPMAVSYLDMANTYDQEPISMYLSPTKYRY